MIVENSALYTPKNEVSMQTIDTHFTERGFQYAQIAREGMVALYSQTHTASGVVRYETVRLHIQAEHTWPNGTTTPEKEAYPSATVWGRRGWTFFTLADAQTQMQALLAQQDGASVSDTAEGDEAEPETQ
jgi:hypothetical protein